MLHVTETQNFGLLVKGGKKIGKIWRNALALESLTPQNIMSSSTFLFLVSPVFHFAYFCFSFVLISFSSCGFVT